MKKYWFGFVFLTFSLVSFPCRADYLQRFSLGGGVMFLNQPAQVEFELGAEYEYRFMSLVGVGGTINYLFSTPALTLLAVPTVYLHPFFSDFFVSASPLFQFVSGGGCTVGARLGTRIPIPLGPIALIPQGSIDFISGGPNLLLGLGIQF